MSAFGPTRTTGLGRWVSKPCCGVEKVANGRDRPEPTRSRLILMSAFDRSCVKIPVRE